MNKPKFTLKHYEVIASIISRCFFVARMDKNKIHKYAKLNILSLLVHDCAGTFKNDNSRFNEVKFKEACGL